MARGPSEQSPGRRMYVIFLVYRIISLFYCVFFLSLSLHNIFHTPMARYSMFVLKVLLNTD